MYVYTNYHYYYHYQYQSYYHYYNYQLLSLSLVVLDQLCAEHLAQELLREIGTGTISAGN